MTDDVTEPVWAKQFSAAVPEPPNPVDVRRVRRLGTRRRRLQRLGMTAALGASTALAVVGVAALYSPPDKSQLTSERGTCPSTVAVGELARLPASTSDQAGGPDRLAAASDPQSMLICQYRFASSAWTVSTQREVTGLQGVGADLAVPREASNERSCAFSGKNNAPVVARLGYSDGYSWIASSLNGCLGSSNGEFTSSTSIGQQLARAGEKAYWVSQGADPLAPSPCLENAGRLGQERILIPDAPTSATVCRGAEQNRQVPADQMPSLVKLLNSAPTTRVAPCPRGGATYLIAFSYGAGRKTSVMIETACRSTASNGNLTATLSDRDLQELDNILR